MKAKGRIVTTVGAMLVLIGVGSAAAQDATLTRETTRTQSVKRQTVCPVMGGAINTNIFADYEGKRVYFCCQACPAQFEKDPAKYIAKLEKDGVTLDKIQTTCPVTGDKIDKAIFRDYEAKRVYFCCQDCLAKFDADPKKIVEQMEKEGIVLEKADKAAPAEKAPKKEMDHSTMQH